MSAADPGATPPGARVPAPDLARGGMLLLIALANVHNFVFRRPPGVRGYPADLEGADRFVVVAQMLLVDGRAYPLFSLLFGYGVVQLARRRAVVGLPAQAVIGLVQRRGAAMIGIGLVHGVLLWSGEIVGAYGLLAVLMAGLLILGSNGVLLATTAVGVLIATLSGAAAAVVPGVPTSSMDVADPGAALARRASEWFAGGFLGQAVAVFGGVAIGAWAARRGLLDEPERHRRLLVGAAVGGIGAAVLGGLPLASAAAGWWTPPPAGAAPLAGGLHVLGGLAGGAGYAALFGLLAIRVHRTGGGALTGALRAGGQRSLSCYLAQSVAFAGLLPAWTLGLGADARLWQVALLGLGVWTVVLGVAVASDRAGHRGPAERLVRRLTYGPGTTPTRPDPTGPDRTEH